MKPGIVFIGEHLDRWPHVDLADLVRRGVDLRTFSAGDLMCWTALFSAHWESGDRPTEFAEGPERVSAEEAFS
jgi:hypothetical protein